ncbi:hypothetical protein C2S52_017292 [Perilla frutescens var. hirtella]|nr:hypothetical protein C2S52_017292 [Perilla frutescens var. hirtella]KAH6811078.1 hypothetical protein C2S51_024840 [Perilla frutescens var. frutescens]
MSPYQALYGRPPFSVLAYQKGTTKIQALDEQLVLRDEVLRELKQNLLQAQHRMQQQANRKRREVEFQVGDLLLVKLQPYRQMSVTRRSYNKLVKKYYGPFPIVERLGTVAYHIELPKGSKIHPVFHVSLLRLFRGTTDIAISELPLEDVDGKPVSLPAAVRSVKTVLLHGKPELMVLVQWQGSPSEESTWELASEMATLYPDFHLEDKVLFPDGRNDTSGVCGHIREAEPDNEESIAKRKLVRTRVIPARFRD